MLNRSVAAALVLLALAACASAPPAPAAKATAARNTMNCVATPTGLLAPPKDCAASGHTWTQQDISRSGAATTADALRLLDPTLTVTGH